MNLVSSEKISLAQKHVQDILQIVFQHSSSHAALIVFDPDCELARILSEAYQRCLTAAKCINFHETTPQAVLDIFDSLKPLDLVVLIQSTSFRLDAFRIRIELFNRSLKVIEHPHLSNMKESEIPYYIDSLAYDPQYFRVIGPGLKKILDRAQTAIVNSGGEHLIFKSGFEPAKLNVGDYSEMKNKGGQFPIGEVFTEAKNLEAVNGRVRIFAFGDTEFKVNKPEQPVTLIVENGRVTGTLSSNPEFDRVLASIRADEGEVWVRELGLGLNRAFTQDRLVSDIGTYERMCGIHLSLGAKHAVYKKQNFTRKTARHHVDVFAVTEKVTLDDQVVFEKGAWC